LLVKAVLLTGDLMFLSRVQGAAKQVGVTLASGRSADSVLEALDLGAAALVMIDLGVGPIDLSNFVSHVRQKSPSAKIVAYGPHVHGQRLADAKDAGCDVVMTRGQFNTSFPSLLAECAGRG
jgi:DNA-binding NarL/FixJ family response regulator